MYLIAALQSFLQLLVQIHDLLWTAQPPAQADTCADGCRISSQWGSRYSGEIRERRPFEVWIMKSMVRWITNNWSTGGDRQL